MSNICSPGETLEKFSFETYNCHGFKQSYLYIKERLDVTDVICLQETWLRPHELGIISEVLETDAKLSIFSKSSMDEIQADYNGRPFGGVAIICKQKPDVYYRELDTNSKRLIAVGMYDKRARLIQVIVSVYMPFYNIQL